MSSLNSLIEKWKKEAEALDPEKPRMHLSDNRKDSLVTANLNGQVLRLVLCIRELEEVVRYMEGEPL